MMSIELLLDAATDARLRSEWNTLLAAGLPSQARHSGESNAPHITLLAAASVGVPPAAAPATPSGSTAVAPGAAAGGSLASALPIEVLVGGFIVFGAPPRGLVLARPVVVSQALLSLHAATHSAASALPGGVEDLSQVTAPGRWTPHITLAHRLTPAQLAEAVAILAPAAASAADAEHSPPPSRATSLRHWNGTTRTVTPL